MEECIFCKIVKGEIPPGLGKIYNSDNFLGFLDIHPKAEGHTLIIPKKHYKNILDMPASSGNELIDAVKDIALGLIKQGKAEGFNFIVNNGEVSGQIVPHLHIHIIPRKNGDGLRNLE
jgi:histidine triad (HIT) family protein